MKELLGLVAIVKNETKYLLEWIAHYRSIGVANIVLYDNDNDAPGKALLQDLALAGLITLVEWSVPEGTSPQLSAYTDALVRFRDRFEFIAFFDADEFLDVRDDVNIAQWLAELPPDVSAIAVNQWVFGSSGLKTAGDGLVTARFTLSAEADYPENLWVKSIYRVDRVRWLENPHRGILQSGRYILPCGRDAFAPDDKGGQAVEIDFSVLALHHYIIKSLEEFMEKRSRGGAAATTQEQRMARYDSLGFFHGRDAKINTRENRALADRADIVSAEISLLKQAIGAH